MTMSDADLIAALKLHAFDDLGEKEDVEGMHLCTIAAARLEVLTRPFDDERLAAQLIEAVRIVCIAEDVHLMCSYPTCKCKAIPTAVKAALAASPSDGWRTIESAPKDGTRILVFTIYGEIELSDWFTCPRERYEAVGELFRRVIDEDGAWNSNRPTHWMPLPPPPQPAVERE